MSTLRIDVRVIPRASTNAVDGMRDGRVLVRVTAPPVDRAANDAVIDVLAKAYGVPKRCVRIIRGETSRNKTIEIGGRGCFPQN